MRLQQVMGLPFSVQCCVCQRHVQTDRVTVYADLDGEPFKAYVEAACVEAYKQAETRKKGCARFGVEK